MKNILIQYKPFFAFFIKFLLFYAIFAFLYKMYLNQYDAATNEVDYFTKVVANQTIDLLNLLYICWLILNVIISSVYLCSNKLLK